MTNPIPTGRPLSAREFLSLQTSGIPFIPELHADDCDNVTCARCVKPPTSTSRMDVPAAQVAADMKAELIRRRLNPTAEDLAWLAAHPVKAEDGLCAEYRHLLHDADPDSAIPAFPDLAKGRRGVQS